MCNWKYCADNSDSLDKIRRFTETCKLKTLAECKRENMNRSITSNEFELVITNLPSKKSLGLHLVFIGEYYETFIGEIIPILKKLFQKT